MVDELIGKIIGLPIDSFIATLDLDDDLPLILPEWPKDMFRSLEKLAEENDIAENWMKVVNSNELSSGLKFSLSRYKPHPGDKTRQRVDGAFFDKDRVPTNGAPNWPDQVISTEFKKGDTSTDPFEDLTDGRIIGANAISRVRCRGQNISYAEHIFSSQHRTLHFSLLVMGHCFRALCWERSGVIVTPRINYVLDPSPLCKLLLAFGCASRNTLGFDPHALRLQPTDPHYIHMTHVLLPQPFDVQFSTSPIPTPIPDGDFDPKPTFAYVRNAFRKSIEDPLSPRYKLSVPQADGILRDFLVGKPAFVARGMVGRGTRGYVAIDCSTGRFVYLKDAWRANYDLLEPEGDILAKLNEKTDEYGPVYNVPTLVCHGDLGDQTTITPALWESLYGDAVHASDPEPEDEPPMRPRPFVPLFPTPTPTPTSSFAEPMSSNFPPSSQPAAQPGASHQQPSPPPKKNPFRRHRHYRIVVEEVGMPLSSFRNGRELFVAIYQCLDAHFYATQKTKILHRDVSAGNILLYPVVHTVFDASGNVTQRMWIFGGMLTDWELAKCILDLLPRQPERTGTWQFMSVASLLEPGKALFVSDEVESFFHVIIYHAIRYMFNNCTNVYSFMKDYFDGVSYDGAIPTCGEKKSATMQNGKLAHAGRAIKFHSPSTKSHPANRVLAELLKRFKAFYHARELAVEDEGADGNVDVDCPLELPMVEPSNGLVSLSKSDVPTTPPAESVEEDASADSTPSAIGEGLSEEEKALADDIETHKFFGELLRDAINNRAWPKDDKTSDQLAPYFKNASKKRGREEQEEEDDTFGVFVGDRKRFRVSTTSFAPGSQVPMTPSSALKVLSSYTEELEAKEVERQLSPDDDGL
ncbi:hypothetical protein C8Q80DRAFT_1187796 [Daedaleopsis nitida]|nr:hypothetical protein C8Q80DRAFT_1187796 [Daedaleopsis nitida]